MPGNRQTNPAPRGTELDWVARNDQLSYRFFLDENGDLWGTNNGPWIHGMPPHTTPPDPRDPNSKSRFKLASGVMSYLIANIEGSVTLGTGVVVPIQEDRMIIMQQDPDASSNFDLMQNSAPHVPIFELKVDGVSDWNLSVSGTTQTIQANRRQGSSSRFDGKWTSAEFVLPNGEARFFL